LVNTGVVELLEFELPPHPTQNKKAGMIKRVDNKCTRTGLPPVPDITATLLS
jgi:hypothetical protein